MIAIVDYGMGNRRSVEKALEHVGARSVVTRDHDEIRAADGVILPGVGAFPQAMRNLAELGLDDVVRERAPAAARARTSSSRPSSRSLAMAGGKAPTPGTTSPSAVRRSR